jgi:hypothetical protein
MYKMTCLELLKTHHQQFSNHLSLQEKPINSRCHTARPKPTLNDVRIPVLSNLELVLSTHLLAGIGANDKGYTYKCEFKTLSGMSGKASSASGYVITSECLGVCPS